MYYSGFSLVPFVVDYSFTELISDCEDIILRSVQGLTILEATEFEKSLDTILNMPEEDYKAI